MKKKMTSAEIRQLFLEYFSERDHEVVPSSSLVPANDPTLLFTNAGMVPFKEVFTGQEKRKYVRAVSSQRCVRAGGKHNDLENVGYTARHHTFFEMLGNFSFGDYFKREAIQYAWEFLTVVAKLPADRLVVTVYEEDKEAADIWLKEIGIDPQRFILIGDKPGGKKHESDNFWSMGDTGPCGPCSEIFYDHGADIDGGPPGSPEEDGDRYVEIWNLVFMQYDRDAKGSLNPLPHPSVDTGMGLERLAAVLQGVHNNYDIDLFQHLIKTIAKLSGQKDLTNTSLRVVADHIRACAFLITDGVVPSNEGRGYVLRRIVRRAIRHGHKLGLREPFFYKLVDALCQEMGDAYPELVKAKAQIERSLKQEEERFAETLDQGMQILEDEISDEMRFARYANSQSSGLNHFQLAVPGSGTASLMFTSRIKGKATRKIWEMVSVPDGADVKAFVTNYYKLEYKKHESDGEEVSDLSLIFITPPELYGSVQKILASIDIKSSKDFRIQAQVMEPKQIPLDGNIVFKLYDTFGFPADLTADIARERGLVIDMDGFDSAMDAQRERARSASNFGVATGEGLEISAQTDFTGYDQTAGSGKVVALFCDGAAVKKLSQGEQGLLVLDHTPFYAESGGQVGDQGVMTVAGSQMTVLGTQKQGDAFLHQVKVTSGSVSMGNSVDAQVDANRRQETACNHSATHLLHAALRKVLGDHVQQKGSLVNAERLRFDFSHFEAITQDQLAEIESMVNEQIRANVEVETKLMSQEDAVASGAMALFGEKYGDTVRVLSMGDFSVELCGGTHVRRTGDIGLLKVTSEGGVAAGVRRIEAVAGEGALNYIGETEKSLTQIAGILKADAGTAEAKVRQLMDRSRALEKEVDQLKSKLASSQGGDLASQAVEVDGIKVLAARLEGGDAKSLRDTVDQLKNKLGAAAVVLAAVDGDKVSLVAGVTKGETKRIRAGDLVNNVAQQVGGKGGGRPDMAQAGGKDPSGLDAALQAVPDWVRAQLGS